MNNKTKQKKQANDKNWNTHFPWTVLLKNKPNKIHVCVRAPTHKQQ